MKQCIFYKKLLASPVLYASFNYTALARSVRRYSGLVGIYCVVMLRQICKILLNQVLQQVRYPFVNSALQLAALGSFIYYLALVLIPDYSCSASQLGMARNILTCEFGAMPDLGKVMILFTMLVASLLCGRAASLVERSFQKSRTY